MLPFIILHRFRFIRFSKFKSFNPRCKRLMPDAALEARML